MGEPGLRGGGCGSPGSQGVKAVGGGSLWQEDTPVRRAAGGAQVRNLRCQPAEKEGGRVEARAGLRLQAVESWA